jgi:hypothetical protein
MSIRTVVPLDAALFIVHTPPSARTRLGYRGEGRVLGLRAGKSSAVKSKRGPQGVLASRSGLVLADIHGNGLGVALANGCSYALLNASIKREVASFSVRFAETPDSAGDLRLTMRSLEPDKQFLNEVRQRNLPDRSWSELLQDRSVNLLQAVRTLQNFSDMITDPRRALVLQLSGERPDRRRDRGNAGASLIVQLVGNFAPHLLLR